MDVKHLATRQSYGGGVDNNGPSLWVFLVIVLGVLLVLVVGTSAVMHLIQARQRRTLARRIANGEVDLEMLGLKKLNVPQEQVDKMPQYIYDTEAGINVQMPEPTATTAITAPSENRRSTMYAQSTCSICLDDFVDKETTVRELPCNHIFHPECIDPFMMNNSSLCPLCKKSALPSGFCPVTVTNVMVRRERLGRTMRNNRMRSGGNRFQASTIYARSVAQRERAAQQPAAPTAPAAPTTPTPAQDTELGTITSPQPSAAVPPPEIASQGREARRAWRREQLAQQHAAEFDQQGEDARVAEARRPWWRRIMGIA